MNEEKHSEKKLTPDILKWVIVGFVGFIAIILIFGVGMKVGGLKARYSYRWAESYHKNFGGPKGGFFGDWRSFPKGDLIEGHGAFGEIIEINPSTSSGQAGFVIKGRGDIEQIIMIAKNTVIKEGMKTIEDGLKVGDSVVIIGNPNDSGQIEAKLIRLMPQQPEEMRLRVPPRR